MFFCNDLISLTYLNRSISNLHLQEWRLYKQIFSGYINGSRLAEQLNFRESRYIWAVIPGRLTRNCLPMVKDIDCATRPRVSLTKSRHPNSLE